MIVMNDSAVVTLRVQRVKVGCNVPVQVSSK